MRSSDPATFRRCLQACKVYKTESDQFTVLSFIIEYTPLIMYFNLDIPLQVFNNESKSRKLHRASSTQHTGPSLVNVCHANSGVQSITYGDINNI